MSFAHNIDFAQIMIWSFWIFFAVLVYYLRREDKREGYPLESARGPVSGWPAPPPKKTYIMRPEVEVDEGLRHE
jgi:photosynthetic reaction center H subunit